MKEVVVLIHGLWMFGPCLGVLGRRIRRCGYDVRFFSYPSVSLGLEQNAARLQQFLLNITVPTTHFVGHSLGGILIRALFHFHPHQRPGRIITLGSPHQGSHVAKRLLRTVVGRRLIGVSIGQIERGDPDCWLLPPREIGVISGRLGIGMGMFSPGLAKPHDGLLSLAETRLPEAADHITLPINHLGMIFSRKVAHECCHFLDTGRFTH